MNIVFKNNKVEKQCNSLREAKKQFPENVAKKLLKLINFILAAENLESIINAPYNFHNLKGDKTGLFAMDIAGRSSSYRLIVSFDGATNEQIFSTPMTVVSIEVEEVSKHYE